jgi:hypothetical protein
MWRWVQALDSILRGETTRLARLRDGQVDAPVAGLTVLILLLGAFYGFCMGWFALLHRESPEFRQLFAAMLKVPALFLLTLLVTFPSLYVFNALVGSRLQVLALLRLLIMALAVTLAVLASFGTIVAFFSLTTSSYPFMVLLNVVLCAVAGFLGLAFLLQTLHRLALPVRPLPAPPSVVAVSESTPGSQGEAGTAVVPPAEPGGALEPVAGSVLGRNVKMVFSCWVVVFALVGAQMSWVLRPFIGAPDQPFAWFRARESNFFEAVWDTLQNLFS